MTVTTELAPTTHTATRDPRQLLNAVRPYIAELTYNVLESPGSVDTDLYEREVRLLLRDEVAVRSLAERILDNAIMYIVTSMERSDLHLGVGKTVDIGVHQIILDTPVYFALCELYNGGRYKHHAPLILRRRDGPCCAPPTPSRRTASPPTLSCGRPTERTAPRATTRRLTVTDPR